MIIKGKIVHLLEIVLAGMTYFQKCPPAFYLGRYSVATEIKQNLPIRIIIAPTILFLLIGTANDSFFYNKLQTILRERT